MRWIKRGPVRLVLCVFSAVVTAVRRGDVINNCGTCAPEQWFGAIDTVITAAAVALVPVGVVAVAVEALDSGEKRGIEAPGRGEARLDVATALCPDALGRAVGAGAPLGALGTFALEAADRAHALPGAAVDTLGISWIAGGRAVRSAALGAAL